MYNAKSDAALQRAINRFKDACDDLAFKGTIPVFSEDPREAELLRLTHEGIDVEYEQARDALVRLVERRANKPLASTVHGD